MIEPQIPPTARVAPSSAHEEFFWMTPLFVISAFIAVMVAISVANRLLSA